MDNFTHKIKYVILYYIIAPLVITLINVSSIVDSQLLFNIGSTIDIIAVLTIIILFHKRVVKETGDPLKVLDSIVDYDFDEIDKALLKTKEIKEKHIDNSGSKILTSETIAKNHYKKLT